MTAHLTAPVEATSRQSQQLLRLALKLDAVASGGNGVAYVAGAAALADLLGLPMGLLLPAGIFLIGYAAALWLVATRPTINRRLAWTTVVVNLLWAVDSIVLLLGGWIEPTALGVALVVGQAAAVAGFAVLQWLGLRRSR